MRAKTYTPAAVGALLALLLLGPALRRGYLLTYDMVFVPDPPLTRGLLGLSGTAPRAVPSDALVAVASTLLPSDVVQKLVLFGIVVLAAAGAARLVPSDRLAARLAAAVLYAWNPYVYERLLLGHWALLLAYAGLPWVLSAAAGLTVERAGPPAVARLGLSMLPAAAGGFAGLIVTGLLATVTAAVAPREHAARRLRHGLVVVAATVTLGLPWLVPSLLRTADVPVVRAAVDAFAARSDTPLGSAGSLLLLGGAWNREVVPPGYGDWLPTLCRLVLTGAAGWGFWRLRTTMGTARWRGLAGSALAGFGIAALGVTAPGRAAVAGLAGAWWPAGALRDGQQYVAPLALLEAVGWGGTVAALLERRRGDLRSAAAADLAPRQPAAVLAAFAVVAPVAVLPALALGASGRLEAVSYPPDWQTARAIVDSDRRPGPVVVLPWSYYRGFPWNRERVSLDPAPRMFARRAVLNDELRIASASGTLVVPPEDPAARRLGPLLRSTASLTGALERAGVRFVIIERSAAPSAEREIERLPGATVVLAGRELLVVRLRPVGAFADPAVPAVPVVAGLACAGGFALWSILVTSYIAVTGSIRESSVVRFRTHEQEGAH